MKRFGDLDYRTRETLKGWMIIPLCIFAVAWGVAFAIDALSIDDRNTLDEAQHARAIPAGVLQLAPDAYLIHDGADTTPLDLCIGSTTSDERVTATKKIEDLDSTYVGCALDQQWSVAEESINPGIFEAVVIAIQKPSFLFTGIGGLILVLIFPVFMLLREIFATVVTHKARKEKARQKYNALAARYSAIQASYSRDEIDDLQFDKKVQELVDAGYQVPDREIFKP